MDKQHYKLSDVLRLEYLSIRPHADPAPDNAEQAHADSAADDSMDAHCAALRAIQRRMLDDETGLAALCLSGGGIRSATFALGLIQGLAKLRLLERFDYLSTVSGGGYLGGWLSAWAQRHPQGIAGVSAELRATQTDGCSAMHNLEPAPIRHLREYSNYLAPRLGPLSVDAWTLAATYLRNLSLNWLVIIPLLAALLLLPRFYATALTLRLPATLLDALSVVMLLLVVWGLVYVGLDRPSAGGRNRDQNSFLSGCLLPLGLAVLLLSLGWVWLLRQAQYEFVFYLRNEVIVAFATGVYFGAWCVHLWPIRKRLKSLALNKVREGLAALISGVLAGFLLLGWTKVFSEVPDSALQVALYTCFAAPTLWLVFTSAETIFVGLSSRVTCEDDREWWARSGAWILIVMTLWIALSLIVSFGPELLFWLWRSLDDMLTAIGGITGLLTYWAARTTMSARRAESAASEPHAAGGAWKEQIAQRLLTFLAPIAVIAILILLVYVTDLILKPDIGFSAYAHLELLRGTPLSVVMMLCAVAVMFSLLMARFINVNRFSLHAMYRNRLIRAYLGASRERFSSQPKNGSAHPFTGFDPEDNIDMHALWPTASQRPLARAPLLVINIALNLVQGKRLAWQQRKAASFTVTPQFAGGCCVGYRKARYYGGEQGISLGTAMTISGAAASPNMGYHTTPYVCFLMSLFNARLGWWLGNPQHRVTWPKKGPNFSVTPLVDEMLGRTHDENPWVYLSDGGHFDNLGLYEMIQRRCRWIVVSDAGADPTCGFEDLGNALRKIRTDLGVQIELEGEQIQIRSRHVNPEGGLYCAVFKIIYAPADATGPSREGHMLYIKPAVYGNEPLDICNYAREQPAFPHEPTRDQFFGESQFESYRHLGEYVIATLAKGWHSRVTTLENLFDAGRRHCGLPE